MKGSEFLWFDSPKVSQVTIMRECITSKADIRAMRHRRIKKQILQEVSYITLAEWLNYFVQTECSSQATISEVIQNLSQRSGIAFTYY